ncbi:hypothetical protein NJB18183_31590, partial [Mycobacterium montefiorense]
PPLPPLLPSHPRPPRLPLSSSPSPNPSGRLRRRPRRGPTRSRP